MKERTQIQCRQGDLPAWITPILLMLETVCLGIMSMYFGCGAWKLPLLGFQLENPLLVVLNTLPLMILALCIWLLTDHAWVGALGSAVVCLLYSWAEYWKLMARSEPIYAEDLLVIREAARMSGRYITITWQIVLSAVLAAGCVLLCRLLCRRRLRHLPVRLGMCGLLLLLSFGLYQLVYTDMAFYNSLPVYEGFDEWNSRDRYLSTGALYPFIHTIPSAVHTPPESYSSREAAAILAEYPDADIPEDRRVSVVCVMLEAMADFSECTDVITENDPYVNYHAMEAESYSGRLVTNIFSGGTIDTERTVLTGFRRLGSFRTPSWSYARYFADQGYTLDGAHAWNASFYSRDIVNESLGFADYRFIENYYCNIVDGTPWDDTFIPDITSVCLQKISKNPVFSYNVTYQNHGPYSADAGYFEKEYVSEEAVDPETYNMMNNYLSGIEDTWARLMDMKTAFAAAEEPIVLVLFGDHKPWMGEQNAGYQALGVNLTQSMVEGFFNYYATDYIIWANAAAKQVLGCSFIGEGPDISACYLMNELFDLCGWEGPAYRKLSDEAREIMPVAPSVGRYLWENTIVGRDALSEEAKLSLNRMEQVGYYLEYDYLKGGRAA